MAIRKTGAVTGHVTEVEQDGIQVTAAAGSHAWTDGDDHELTAENAAADQGDD